MKNFLRRGAALLGAALLMLPSVNALSIDEAYSVLSDSYLYALPNEARGAETLSELFSYVTDPYTVYMDAEQYADFLSAVEGKESFAGIDAGVIATERGIEIITLSDGGAKDAGLCVGDTIIAIDGVSCVPAEDSDILLLRGTANSRVRVTVLRSDGSTKDFTVTRRSIVQTNTNIKVKNGIGYITCSTFGTQTGEYFADGIRKNDDAVRAWIVDLRSNTGGVTDSAVTALGCFAGVGNMLTFKARDGYCARFPYTGQDLTDHPAVVLTDNLTASSSEILASGIVSLHCGITVGSRSYGKGVAQIVYDEGNCPYFDGDALKVTAYRFYCAGGSTTDRIGVLPTLVVSPSETEAVAELLCGEKPSDGSPYLHLVLNGLDFYVNTSDAPRPTLDALLTALTPKTELYLGGSGTESAVTADAARTILGCEAAAHEFSDVSASEYADEINTLAARRLLTGDENALFHPRDIMTRAEVCALLAQALDIGLLGEDHFSDVPSDRWYAPSVNAIASLGLVSGIGGGKFDPDGTMTQQEFITVMGRLAEFLSLDAYRYLDATPLAILRPLHKYDGYASWSLRSLALMTEGIKDENGETAQLLFTSFEKLDASAPILREQAAATMYRTLTALGCLSR